MENTIKSRVETGTITVEELIAAYHSGDVDMDPEAVIVHYTNTSEMDVDQMTKGEIAELEPKALQNWAEHCVSDRNYQTCSL